jgi:large subunit ribosomal protein L16
VKIKIKKFMFLQPKKTKYKKIQKGKLSKFIFLSKILKFVNIGLKAEKATTLSARQIEAARQAIVRKLSRKGKL